MKILTKATLMLAGAAIVATATPAVARPHHQRGHDGIDAGDVIAGALIIGGIAAIASAGSNDRGYDRGRYNDRRYDDRRYDDRRYDDRGYGYDDRGGNGYYQNGYGSRQAVDQCVRAAQRDASRYGRARITDVSTINRIRGGYEIRGRLVVEQRGYRYGDRDQGRYGYNYDRYGNDYDKGRFSCVTRGDRVDDIRISGLQNHY